MNRVFWSDYFFFLSSPPLSSNLPWRDITSCTSSSIPVSLRVFDVSPYCFSSPPFSLQQYFGEYFYFAVRQRHRLEENHWQHVSPDIINKMPKPNLLRSIKVNMSWSLLFVACFFFLLFSSCWDSDESAGALRSVSSWQTASNILNSSHSLVKSWSNFAWLEYNWYNFCNSRSLGTCYTICHANERFNE